MNHNDQLCYVQLYYELFAQENLWLIWSYNSPLSVFFWACLFLSFFLFVPAQSTWMRIPDNCATTDKMPKCLHRMKYRTKPNQILDKEENSSLMKIISKKYHKYFNKYICDFSNCIISNLDMVFLLCFPFHILIFVVPTLLNYGVFMGVATIILIFFNTINDRIFFTFHSDLAWRKMSENF